MGIKEKKGNKEQTKYPPLEQLQGITLPPNVKTQLCHPK